MVTDFGMSAKVGSVKLGSGDSSPFLGKEMTTGKEYSENLAATVDSEVRGIIDEAHDEAYWALTENRHVLDRLAEELLRVETLGAKEVAAIFHDVKKRPRRRIWESSPDRPIVVAGETVNGTPQSTESDARPTESRDV